MDRVGFVIDDRCLLHDPGPGHPESPQRLAAVREALLASDPPASRQPVAARPARPDELALIHDPSYIESVEKACARGAGRLDPDTGYVRESCQAALLAAGAALECVDRICTGRLERAFAFVRPPGHHALPARAMGFCFFNNVAIAAAYARARHGLERIAVVDFDLHHGNGTQAAFYRDPHVLYVSSHQFPFYPGTGAVDEIGEREGKGYTLNFPLPAGTGDATFVPLYRKVVSAVLEQFRPQLVLVSAGFDAHRRDPLGGLLVSTEGFAWAAGALVAAADRCCGGRILFVLEGGYDMDALRSCTRAVMEVLERGAPDAPPPAEDRLFRELSERVRCSAGDLWKW